MESLEAILAMNGKHPPGRRSTSIDDLVARVKELEKELREEREKRRRMASELIGGGPLTPEELQGDYVLRGRPKPPADREKPQEGRSLPISGPSALTLDTQGVRRLAEDGYPVLPAQVLALCERVGALEEAARGLLDATAHAWTKPGEGTLILADAELRMEKVLAGATPLHALVSAARAWAGAVAEQNMDAIEAAERDLIVAIAACS